MKLIERIAKEVKQLTPERQQLVWDYVLSLASIDEEALQRKEEEAIAQLGYNPTTDLSDWEWDAMERRNQMSLENEARKK